jgi:beta-galactosidase
LGVATRVTAATASSPRRTRSIATRRSNFDQQWRFFLGDPPNADKVTLADAAWRKLDLPHDWSIEGPFDEHAPAKGNGAYLPTEIGWYRKSLVLPPSARDKRITLEFDGVYQRSAIWINGTSLGMRPYGFIGFSYDLTLHLAPLGRPNHIAIRVDNSLQPNCRWYSGSEIYRHTWLCITDPLHIAQWGLCAHTLC